MKKLIDELKNEHKTILAILGEIKALGISSRAGQEKLLAARDLLMAHMRKEDEHYYPELRRAAESSKELKILMDYFIADMESVSKTAIGLFDKYAQGGDEAEFAGEIKLLYVTLKDRILTEEETLFGKFPGQ
jgi:hypothetical protein